MAAGRMESDESSDGDGTHFQQFLQQIPLDFTSLEHMIALVKVKMAMTMRICSWRDSRER
jgi:hypothetical protein